MRNKKTFLGSVALFGLICSAISSGAHAFAQQESVLYNFGEYANGDGVRPESALIFDAAGNLYGTTFGGGANGYGSVFELSPDGSGGWTETVLHSFANRAGDGINPPSSLVFDSEGNLYGTTPGGGAYGGGTVFELTPAAGGGWHEHLLVSFSGKCGSNPVGSLMINAAGSLFGTTTLGGTYGLGTVFALIPSPHTGWTEVVLHSFGNGADGSEPYSSLTFDASGNLYGTTLFGGDYANGAVFELMPKFANAWSEKLIHSFGESGDGYESFTGVVFDASGNLYGTTYGGGAYSRGTVFELTPEGDGRWRERLLHSFSDNGADGYAPYAALAVNPSGNLILYGTTYSGGAFSGGTVFELTSQSGAWTETVVHSFHNNGIDGINPEAGLTFDGSGNLYGTTAYGGLDYANFGTVFEITP